MARRAPTTRSERIFLLALMPAELALIGGAYAAAAAHSRVGVFVMLSGFLGLFLVHLLTGIDGYRRTMRREWPSVPSLDDWDED